LSTNREGLLVRIGVVDSADWQRGLESGSRNGAHRRIKRALDEAVASDVSDAGRDEGCGGVEVTFREFLKV
jgi:hypothetical protein